MPFPMLENPSGEYCIFNGERIPLDSTIGASLSQPISDIIYYESIRLRDGILVFLKIICCGCCVRLLKKRIFR